MSTPEEELGAAIGAAYAAHDRLRVAIDRRFDVPDQGSSDELREAEKAYDLSVDGVLLALSRRACPLADAANGEGSED